MKADHWQIVSYSVGNFIGAWYIESFIRQGESIKAQFEPGEF